MQVMTITHSPLGRKLRNPLTIPVPEAQTPSDQKLQQYVIMSLSWKKSSLVPFVFNNTSTQELAKYLLRHRTASTATLYLYMFSIHRFSQWTNMQPDQLIKNCQDQDGDPDPKALAKYSRLLDDYAGNLQAENLAPGTVSNNVKSVKAFFRVNRLKLELPYSLSKRAIYNDRAPTPEELSRIIDLAELRQKVIVSMLALGGFRTGTLAKLQYRHVKRDLEKMVTPIHVHVEAEITKGKYHDYDTFIGEEAAEYLKAYIETRRVGTEKIPPENIHDETPLLRNQQCRQIIPLEPAGIHDLVHALYVRAGILPAKPIGRRYELRAHSIRKFFRTQMAALGVQTDYIEYMMGHTISAYHDIKMKGIEFLRNVYTASGLSIRPKTRTNKIDALKEIIRAWGLNPEEILTRQAMAEPHITVVSSGQREETQIHVLSKALQQEILRKIREGQDE